MEHQYNNITEDTDMDNDDNNDNNNDIELEKDFFTTNKKVENLRA